MPYTAQNEQIAFFNGGMPILRYLPVEGHTQRAMLGNSAEIYEKKQLEREELIRLMAEWGDKLSKQPKCVWESDKQRETTKEMKRLRRNPEVAVPELKKSYYGCLYLLKEWDHLKRVVDSDSFCGEFRTSDETLILGLCEVPFWNRDQEFDWMPSSDMEVDDACEHVRRFVQEKIDGLRELSLARRAEEERERELAIAAPEFFPDKKLRAWAKDLRKLERELIGIFTYVQSLQTPEAKAGEAASGETPERYDVVPKCELNAEHFQVETRQETAECLPVVNTVSRVAKTEITIASQSSRPTPPQTKAGDRRSRSRSRSRKERTRETAKHESRRTLADMMNHNHEQSNILGITIGKRLF